MAEVGDILELKFYGNGISPDTVKPHEIAELITSFERALLATIKQEYPEIDTKHLLFSFQNVDNKSLDLRFRPEKIREIIVGCYTLIATSLGVADYGRLNSDTIDSLRDITRFTKRHECIGQFNYNGQSLSTFTKDTEISIDRSNEVKGETRIYGTVLRVGGEDPNVHFRIDNEYKLIIDVKEDIAKRLATKLYEEVGLIGFAKWDYKSYKVTHFKVTDLVEYEEKPLNETFNQLRNLLGKYWNGIDDINAALG